MVVPSRDYRKFMEDRQIELTDWEKAVLVYNNQLHLMTIRCVI